MEFQRRKRKGKTQDTYREWVSDCGNYRVTWHGDYDSNHYYACVLAEGFNGKEVWDFAGQRRPYKTQKAAEDACLKNQKVWTQFVEISHGPGRRDSALTQLRFKEDQHPWTSVPFWVKAAADPFLLRVLNPRCAEIYEPDPDATILIFKHSDEASAGSDGQTEIETTPTSGPASNASDEDGATIPETTAPSKDTSSLTTSSANTAPEAGDGPEPKSQRPTRKSPTSTKPNSKSGAKKKRSAKAGSKNSPKKKGKH